MTIFQPAGLPSSNQKAPPSRGNAVALAVPHGAGGLGGASAPIAPRWGAWPLRDRSCGASHVTGCCGTVGMSGVVIGKLATLGTRGAGGALHRRRWLFRWSLLAWPQLRSQGRVKLHRRAWQGVCARKPRRVSRFVSPPTQDACRTRVTCWLFVAASTGRAWHSTSSGASDMLGNARGRVTRVDRAWTSDQGGRACRNRTGQRDALRVHVAAQLHRQFVQLCPTCLKRGAHVAGPRICRERGKRIAEVA